VCINICFYAKDKWTGLTGDNYLYQVFPLDSHGILIFSLIYYSISSLKKDTETKGATIEYIVVEVQKQDQERSEPLSCEDEGAKMY
jgi:hypothetical protein